MTVILAVALCYGNFASLLDCSNFSLYYFLVIHDVTQVKSKYSTL